MEKKSWFVVFFLLSVNLFVAAGVAQAGPDGKKCLECHTEMRDRIKSEKVHKPVRKGNCVGCHNPHASRHQGLLKESVRKVCFNCHTGEKGEEFSRSYVHAPVKEGKCVLCHSPHTSFNDSLLTAKKSEICFKCHKKEELITGKEAHPLVRKGQCVTCHEPHSSQNDRLMRFSRKELCSNSKCHPDVGGRLVASHSGFVISGSNCAGCHNPHSSEKKSLLKAVFHKPVAEKKCGLCHLDKSGKKLRSNGISLCLSCHKKTSESFEKISSHLVGNRDNLCLGCHNPHASDNSFLLSGSEERVCFQCHQDTRAFQMSGLASVKHPDIEKCSNCHVTHGSDNILFLKATEAKICGIGKCHDKGVGFTHPMGEQAIDKRNNKEMTCLSCHNPMGTQYDKNLILESSKALCEECHRL